MAVSRAHFNLPPSSQSNLPYQSSPILLFHPAIRSVKRFNSRKLGISCCQQAVQLKNDETQEDNLPTRKKRKPRPSFLDQIQGKWSLKTPSLRESFPWEVEESGSREQGFDAQRLRFPDDVSLVTGVQVIESVRGPDSALKSKSILAPWVHGRENSRRLHESVGDKEFQEKDDIEGQCQNEESLISFVQLSEDLEEDSTFDGDFEENCVDFEDLPTTYSGKSEILGDEDGEALTFKKGSSRISREVGISGRSASANGLNRLPWEMGADENLEKGEKLRKNHTEISERLIPENELKRLRNVALRTVERMKVGAAGVTQALVDAIHEKWKNEEVVNLKFEGPPSINMKRTHEVLERKTGGLIIHRSGSLVVVYRGMTYKLDCVKSYVKHIDAHIRASDPSEDSVKDSPQSISVKHVSRVAESSEADASNYSKNISNEEEMSLHELNCLLDEVGPRFMDWSGREPLPVDADLLPAVVPGHKPPFRLLPHGTRKTLKDKEMTYLRRTARTMPPHFALGRNRELQGLAMAMVNLWKKSAIAKIAIKRGVLNTSNERMAEELKILTGGTLLSRNKDYIVFYRGNDFLPPGVESALVEAEKNTAFQQDEEEHARHRAATLIDSNVRTPKQPLVAGTLAETVAATSRWGNQPSSAEIEKMRSDTAVSSHVSLVNSVQRKLAFAKHKMKKAEKSLQKVLGNQEPANLPTDLETLTDEERFLFRKMGLSMKRYLVLGRREIFDGTIENMHLHWKYRELVKIIVDRKKFPQVKHIAVSLEAESGGLLVSVEKVTKGYVIIVYRGKNYQPPSAFRPKNLLTKRQALVRSIELQRLEALKHHVLELEEKIKKLKEELEDMKTEIENDSENLDLSLDTVSDSS
ncbi:CRM-domain containing factor CFM3A, chloroplastic/mitochondrial [Henckelia pumila]|uniref:CRM-domain containing factor CFM3A, chloroplastic/mitochondrial n=1 Tax=Henckelia pumila TaxID=405737 RepID=UPI003C6E2261